MAKVARQRSKGAGTLILRGRTWCARWMVDGKVFTRTTSTSDRRAAEEKLAEFTAPFRLGSKVETLEAVAVKIDGVKAEIEEYKDGLPAMTLLQAWPAFEIKPKGKTARGRPIKPGARTLADYEGRWNAFCTWMEDTYPKKTADGDKIPWELRQIERSHAERYIAHIDATRSDNTLNKTITFLRLVFKVLAEDARIKANPFDGMEAAPHSITKKRKLTQEELLSVSKLLEGRGELELLFSIGYHTGARLGDCVMMRWGSVDMGARKITFTPRKTKKGNVSITVNIADALFRLLDAVPHGQRRGLVLPSLGALYDKDPAAVSKRVQQVFEAAGIETTEEVKGYGKKVARVGFHSLRCGAITAMIEAGVPLDVVQLQAGHSTIGMTAHYHEISGKALQAASDAIPAMPQTEALPEHADATGANVGAVLALLDGLDVEALKAVVEKARAQIGKREKKEVAQ